MISRFLVPMFSFVNRAKPQNQAVNSVTLTRQVICHSSPVNVSYHWVSRAALLKGLPPPNHLLSTNHQIFLLFSNESNLPNTSLMLPHLFKQSVRLMITWRFLHTHSHALDHTFVKIVFKVLSTDKDVYTSMSRVMREEGQQKRLFEKKSEQKKKTKKQSSLDAILKWVALADFQAFEILCMAPIQILRQVVEMEEATQHLHLQHHGDHKDLCHDRSCHQYRTQHLVALRVINEMMRTGLQG